MEQQWYDLYISGDSHPKRFARRIDAVLYVRRVERLNEEAITLLADWGMVGPPQARRAVYLRPAEEGPPPEEAEAEQD